MGFQDFTVVVNFNDGTNDFDLPHVFSITDPQEGMKATVIEGNRGDGSIVIPGGKRSQEITIRGKLFDNDGFKDLQVRMQEMRDKVTTDVASITLKHFDVVFVDDWVYTVRRISEINFPQSMRTSIQEYEITFIVLAYS